MLTDYRYILAQICSPDSFTRINVGVVMESDTDLQVRFLPRLELGERLLGNLTFQSLSQTIVSNYRSKNWKKSHYYFLDSLAQSTTSALRFSPIFPAPVTNITEGIDLLFKARVTGLDSDDTFPEKTIPSKTISAWFVLYTFFLMKTLNHKMLLQKICYLTELAQEEVGATGLGLKFIRYTYGPFSRELYGVTGLLESAGYIQILSQRRARITDEGKRFISETIRLRDEHPIAASILERVVADAQARGLEAIKKKSYETPLMKKARMDDKLLPLDGEKQDVFAPTLLNRGLLGKLTSD